MSLLDDELDALVARESWPRRAMPVRPMGGRWQQRAQQWNDHDSCACGSGCGGGCGCACARCSGIEADETTRLQAAGNATPASAVGSQMPAWRGWSAPVRLSTLITARNSNAVNLYREFFDRGSRVYRISRPGIDTARPLNIGMTISNSIFERMMQHFGSPRGDRRVRAEFMRTGSTPDTILVQAAILDRTGMHPRRAKGYENWLQDRERPLLYSPDTISFESDDVDRL